VSQLLSSVISSILAISSLKVNTSRAIIERMKQKPQSISYASSGVNYAALDRIKRLAQTKAKGTKTQLVGHGMKENSVSRGESAYVWETKDAYWASVIEGLGTKNLVADAMRGVTGKTYYDSIAQDTVAMIVNDLVVVGAQPLVMSAYFAVGDSAWMEDEERATDLINGWAKACELTGATWGGGETPTLKGIIEPSTIDLGGSCVGIIDPKERLVLGDKLQVGDRILLVESNGIHANGLTLARQIALKVPDGYATKLSDGVMYGESLLRPTHLYSQLVQDIFAAGCEIHYMVNITGHGWRKLMRATKDFEYVLDEVPAPQPLFEFIQEHSGNDLTEMYGNFNMGAGFAIYLPKEHVSAAEKAAKKLGLKTWDAGVVKAGKKQVVIKPHKITFDGSSLEVR
jgi:phosphoribosylformylglycinamidine cyclo-ligase